MGFRFYITPFANDHGTAYGDEIEVTPDVVAPVGTLTQALDQNEYDLGIFRASSFKLKLRNDHGKYLAPPAIYSMFKYNRGGSLVRVTWEPGDGPLIAGFFTAGAPDAIVSEEIEIFAGTLVDDASKSDIDDAVFGFQVLGFEALLQNMIVPYADIDIGDTFSEVLFKCLDQAPFNERVTVSALNIQAGTDIAIDAKTPLENKTVLEAMKIILFPANSVLYIREGVVYTKGRAASADVEYSFYGAGSDSGIENLADVAGYRDGTNRLINYVAWKGTTLVVYDSSSVDRYGYFKKEITCDLITDNTKRTTILTAVKDEFCVPKRECEIVTPMKPDRVELFLLDRFIIDYPSPTVPRENNPVAQYERDEWDDGKFYADELFQLTIEATARFKAISRKIDFTRQTVSFPVREV